jgi:hypothetical protein
MPAHSALMRRPGRHLQITDDQAKKPVMASGDLPRPLRAGDARIKVQNMRRRDFNPVGNNAPADLPLQPQVAKATIISSQRMA